MIERLESLYEAAGHETKERKKHTSEAELIDLLSERDGDRASFADEIRKFPGVGIIAEFKQSSPSLGEINSSWSVERAASEYAAGGAAAMSILTINHKFSGELDFIRRARERTNLPILRKDFIYDKYQMLEAAAYGADAALLIVGGIDDDGELKDLYNYAGEVGLDCLVEVHSDEEVDRALDLEPEVIGINNRDLTHPNMLVNIATFDRLAHRIPSGTLAVAESGYEINKNHKQQIAHSCGNAALIGTALMQNDDPAKAIAEWNRF